jgi:hypothetical protein
MTDQPTNLDLDDIEARAAAATDGPWGFYDGETYADVAADLEMTSRSSYTYRQKVARLEDDDFWDDPAHQDADDEQATEALSANAAFIAHARTDVPALIAEIRRLRARVTELEDDASLLTALQAAGVDNWEGYDDALERL